MSQALQRFDSALLFVCAWILYSICLVGCSAPSQQKVAPWQAGTAIYLDGLDKFIYLPQGYKQTSRYYLHQDVPELRADSLRLQLAQNALHMMELSEGQVFAFADTTGSLDLLIMKITDRVPPNRQSGAVLKHQLQETIQAMDDADPNLTTAYLNSELQAQGSAGLISIEFRMEYAVQNATMWQYAYLFSDVYRSYFTLHITGKPRNLGPYLWSLQ